MLSSGMEGANRGLSTRATRAGLGRDLTDWPIEVFKVGYAGGRFSGVMCGDEWQDGWYGAGVLHRSERRWPGRVFQ